MWRSWLSIVRILLYLVLAGHARAQHDQRVIVVVGSTGSNAVHSVLEAAGVWMHPDTDASLNSRLYRDKVLLPLINSLPDNHTCLTDGRPRRILPRRDQLLQRLVPDSLLPNVTTWHKEMAEEMLHSVPASVDTWAWKHPCALFTSTFLHQAFPNLHVIQQVQDGRDYTLANLLPHTTHTTADCIEQRLVRAMTSFNATGVTHNSMDTLAAYITAVATTWAQANAGALSLAGVRAAGMHKAWSVVRLEDLCDPQGMREAVTAMLVNAQLPHDEATVSRAVERLKAERCTTGLWKDLAARNHSRLAAAMRRIDKLIAPALEAFDYQPISSTDLPSWLEASSTMNRIVAAGRAAAGPSNHPVILTYASNGYERITSNWLAWLQASGVDTSHVLIVAREGGYETVKEAAASSQAVVLSMPLLTPYKSPSRDEVGRVAVKFKNVRGGLWLERVRSIYELTKQGMSVLLTDLDAIWVRNPLPYILTAAAQQQQPVQGFDLVTSSSRAFRRSLVYDTFHAGGCMGFVYFNATKPMQYILRDMLWERLWQLAHKETKYYNDQGHMNQALDALSLHFNATVGQKDLARSSSSALAAWKATTAPHALRVLYMPMDLAQRTCTATIPHPDTLIAHCQSPLTGAKKEAYLKQHNLWKEAPLNQGTPTVQAA